MPVTVSWKSLGLNVEEMNKEYRNWIDYDAEYISKTGKNFKEIWWKLPRAAQDIAVGQTRGRLIRGKRIRFEDMADRVTGKELTIPELEKLGRDRKAGKLPKPTPKKAVMKPAKKIEKVKKTPGEFDPNSIKGTLYREAKTKKEAELIAKEIGFTADYSSFDLAAANNFNKAYARMSEAFPVLKKQDTSVGHFISAVDLYAEKKAKKLAKELSYQKIKGKVKELHDRTKNYKSLINLFERSESASDIRRMSKKYKGPYQVWRAVKDRGSFDNLTKDDILEIFVASTAEGTKGRFKPSRNAIAFTYSSIKDIDELGLIAVNKNARKAELAKLSSDRGAINGFHPRETVGHGDTAIYTHEIGHNVDGILRKSEKKEEWESFLRDTIRDNDIEGEVSGYGATSDKEAVAEAFSSVMDNDGGSKVSRMIIFKLRELLGDR